MLVETFSRYDIQKFFQTLPIVLGKGARQEAKSFPAENHYSVLIKRILKQWKKDLKTVKFKPPIEYWAKDMDSWYKDRQMDWTHEKILNLTHNKKNFILKLYWNISKLSNWHISKHLKQLGEADITNRSKMEKPFWMGIWKYL